MSENLEELTRRARACRICVESPVGRPLPHEPRSVLLPSSRARVLIAGQAPGTKVHVTGTPFTDASGDRLRSWLGVSHDEFYETGNFAIVPMGFCFPGQDSSGSDLPPRRECAPTWRAQLMSLMPQIELVLTIGLYAQAWHIGERRRGTLTETVANWRELFAATSRPLMLPLPHPSWRNTAWMKKNPWFETDLLPFLKTEVRRRLQQD
jgi:uracil-DNA glycosylase